MGWDGRGRVCRIVWDDRLGMVDIMGEVSLGSWRGIVFW